MGSTDNTVEAVAEVSLRLMCANAAYAAEMEKHPEAAGHVHVDAMDAFTRVFWADDSLLALGMEQIEKAEEPAEVAPDA